MGRPSSILLQILPCPLHRLYQIPAMAEGRRVEEPCAAGAEAGGADHVVCDSLIVAERRYNVYAR